MFSGSAQSGESEISPFLSLLLLAPILGVYLPFSIDLGVWTLTPKRFFLFVVIAYAGYRLLLRKQVTVTKLDIGIILLWITLIGSVGWSVSPATSITKADSLLLHTLFFATVVSTPGTKRTLNRLTGGLLFLGFLLTGFGLLALVTGQLGEPSLFGVINRNQFSRHMAVLLPFMVAAAYLETSYRKLLYMLTAVSMLIILALAGSRSGVVVLAVTVPLLAGFYLVYVLDINTGRATAVTSLVPVGTVTTLALLLRAGLLPERFRNIPTTPSELFSPDILGPVRYYLYLREYELINENWLFGIGYGAILARTESVPFRDGYQAHSILTRVWLAAGVGAVLALTLIYLFLIRNYLRQIYNSADAERVYAGAYFIAFIGISIFGMTNSIVYNPIFYVLMGVGSNLLPTLRESESRSPQRNDSPQATDLQPPTV